MLREPTGRGPAIVSARQILTITEVETQSDASGIRTFHGRSIRPAGWYIPVSSEEGDYYVLEGRVLRDLKHRQRLPAETPRNSRFGLSGRCGAVVRAIRSRVQSADWFGRVRDLDPYPVVTR